MRKSQNVGGVERDASGKVIKGDLQMTPIDPHDFYQPCFPLSFADFREPKVQVWENVTFADNLCRCWVSRLNLRVSDRTGGVRSQTLTFVFND
ncbi:MAG: hypothetical protein LH702_05450 [Phormidesmis sp. CAN_BIN44]|nr:hypothetical protein [Phormidesmis sp. CAN_BIN44]